MQTNILLTYKCIQRCMQCNIYENHEEPAYIPFNDFKKIINRLSNYGTHRITLSGGEPVIHPKFTKILEYLTAQGFLNTHLLSTFYLPEDKVYSLLDVIFRSGLSSMSCSFDGFGAVADKLRGAQNVSGTVKRSMEIIDEENKKRNSPLKTSVNIVVSQLNLHHIPDILQFIEKLGWTANIDVYRWTSDNHREMDEMKITDYQELDKVLNLVKKSPAVFTPTWLLDGTINYLKGDFPKLCPYLVSASLGSKFFIHPNGDIHDCHGKVGNLLTHEPREIFKSKLWLNRKFVYETCSGCWNTCYTPTAKFSNYLNVKGLKSVIKAIKRK